MVAAELVWLTSLFSNFRISLPKPPIIWCDNLSVVYLSANPILHSKTKHVELDIHFVRDLVLHKKLSIPDLSATGQVANILTNPLSVVGFLRTFEVQAQCS